MPGWLQNLEMVLGVTQKAHRNFSAAIGPFLMLG
jgi:hypothetical protein